MRVRAHVRRSLRAPAAERNFPARTFSALPLSREDACPMGETLDPQSRGLSVLSEVTA
jgi:hypothetical protein